MIVCMHGHNHEQNGVFARGRLTSLLRAAAILLRHRLAQHATDTFECEPARNVPARSAKCNVNVSKAVLPLVVLVSVAAARIAVTKHNRDLPLRTMHGWCTGKPKKHTIVDARENRGQRSESIEFIDCRQELQAGIAYRVAERRSGANSAHLGVSGP